MIFEGKAIRCLMHDSGPQAGIAELIFDLQGESVNKFNAVTLGELHTAIGKLQQQKGVKGLLITSAKDVFIVGADITEFLGHFTKSENELAAWLRTTQDDFSVIEDLPYPSVAAINGFALGGGFELALSATYRVCSSSARIGLPETKLGIFPGWGGTVRLSRLCGADNAIEWIASGNQYKPEDGLKIKAVDAVTAPDQLRASALRTLDAAIQGKLDWKSRATQKSSPLKLNKIESMMVFEGSKAFVGAQAGPNYPAPLAAIEVMEKGARKTRNEAMQIEAETFAKIAKQPTAAALISIFLADQAVKKTAKQIAKKAQPIQASGVIGAGIMGGGIAFVSASSKIPVVMKDIQPASLALGMQEAIKLLEKQVSRGKSTPAKMAGTLSLIKPTMYYNELANTSIVVEAVTENEKIKLAVLKELEASVKPGTVITSNTSTISIDSLASTLAHPELFCGMHFFNPVPKMPLVEVIRGKKSSEATIATTVAFANALGKTAIVVNDCPGFYINRVLFPYFNGFSQLLREGVDFQKIDKVMTKFGWPMGPAHLLDVVGIDTARHANEVMAKGFPERMKFDFESGIDAMFKANRFGQKNGKGFYQYKPDKKGNPTKEIDPSAYDILKPVSTGSRADISDEEIVDRMMIPMVIESARCLEEKILSCAADGDIGVLYGIGFPPFRGGLFRYADSVGVTALCKKAEQYLKLGKHYEPSPGMVEMAKKGTGFYS